MRDGELPIKVGVLNPQLGKNPVLRTITWCPYGVVRLWLLFELYSEWNEVAIRTNIEQNQWRRDVAVIGITVDSRDVLQQRVIY